MLDFVRPILKSRVLKLIYFHQLMGQDVRDPSKRRQWRILKPEGVPTIFQHVQPVSRLKASIQRKHSIKRTVRSEREVVSKQ